MTKFNKKLKELKRKQKSIQSKDLVVLKTWAKFEEGKIKTNVVESVKTKTHLVKKKSDGESLNDVELQMGGRGPKTSCFEWQWWHCKNKGGGGPTFWNRWMT